MDKLAEKCSRLAGITGSILLVVMMFGTVARRDFGAAHVMRWYVLIFAALGALSSANRYSLDRMKK